MASLAHQVISSKTLSSPSTLNRLEDAVQRSVVLSDGWDVMEFASSCRSSRRATSPSPRFPSSRRTAGATTECRAWCGSTRPRSRSGSTGLLHDQDEGKTEELAYTPEKTTADVVNDSDINGLAAAVSEVLTTKGFTAGSIGNHEGAPVTGSQVQAAKADDLGAQAVSKELGGLPIVEDSSVAPGSVRVVLAADYTGPGSGLDGTRPDAGDTADPVGGRVRPRRLRWPSPIITAGSDDPECVN